MAFLVRDAAHETHEALFLKGLDGRRAVPGGDVLVEADDQGFSGGQFAIGSGSHAMPSPGSAERNAYWQSLRAYTFDQSSSAAMRFGSSAERAPALVSVMMSP